MKLGKNKNEKDKNKTYLVGKQGTPFSVTEAYKALRTNVMFALPGDDKKVIGITSSERGDGKTISAVNLALSLADLGMKVILLECDFRLPTFSRKIRIKSVPGFTDFLIGAAPKEQVIQRDVLDKVAVIPAGRIPRDPTALLQSDQMRKTIEMFRNEYDYIIIDLPPVNVVADAKIISGLVDGYLLVVRHGVSEYNRVQDMVHNLELSKGNIIGFIYNGAPVTEKKYYRVYYGKH